MALRPLGHAEGTGEPRLRGLSRNSLLISSIETSRPKACCALVRSRVSRELISEEGYATTFVKSLVFAKPKIYRLRLVLLGNVVAQTGLVHRAGHQIASLHGFRLLTVAPR